MTRKEEEKVAKTKAEIVRYLRKCKTPIDAKWDPDGGIPYVLISSGVNINEETYEIEGFQVMEQGDGLTSSFGLGEFVVTILGIEFCHDAATDIESWKESEWSCQAELKDGILRNCDDIDMELQKALDDNVGYYFFPSFEERCDSISDKIMSECFSDADIDLFYVDEDEKTPSKVYGISSDEQEDELEELMIGKKSITETEAINILQRIGYVIDLVG